MQGNETTWNKASRRRLLTLLGSTTAMLMISCAETPDSLEGNAMGPGNGNGINVPAHTVLDDRTIDYNEALRTASLKLLRTLPTLDQIKQVENSSDPRATYQKLLDEMFENYLFQERMIQWWSDVMRQAGGPDAEKPSRDTAPLFAARLTAEGSPYSSLFTATSNTCPSYDFNAHTFVDGDCNNNVPAHAGVLTNPGVMYQFYGNMAFRRVRWVQEIFVCTKFPAEYSDTPVQKNGADYVSPWKFESVATAPIDFQDTSSVICANCHTTMNHIAPLFANFDQNGVWSDSIQVLTPFAPDPIPTEMSHWLATGEPLSWRLGEPVTNLTELGQAIAADPDVGECAVARAWNFVMSKEDIVSDLSTVPTTVIQPFLDEFNQNGMNLKAVLRSMFLSDDFVKF